MYLIKISCGSSKTSKLFDDTSGAVRWLADVEQRVIEEGCDVVRPSGTLPGRIGLAVRIEDKVIVATGQPVDAAVLKEHVKAPDWCIKLLLALSPN